MEEKWRWRWRGRRNLIWAKYCRCHITAYRTAHTKAYFTVWIQVRHRQHNDSKYPISHITCTYYYVFVAAETEMINVRFSIVLPYLIILMLESFYSGASILHCSMATTLSHHGDNRSKMYLFKSNRLRRIYLFISLVVSLIVDSFSLLATEIWHSNSPNFSDASSFLAQTLCYSR